MGIFSRLVVGVDGSSGGENALRWAAAQNGSGEVIAVHGFSPGEQLIAAAAQINLDGVRAEHESLLLGQWTDPAREIGIEPKCELIDDNGANAMMMVATNHGSSTIVVGHHGQTGWTHHHVGANAGKLLHRCVDPLVIIGARTPARLISGPIMVAVSGTADLHLPHLAWAADLGRRLDLPVHLIAVNQPPTYFDPSIPPDSEAVSRANDKSMRNLTTTFGSLHSSLEVSGQVRDGLATTEIAAAIAEVGAGIVVLGNHHPSRAAALMGGSVLRHLPSEISCPMVAIPA